MTLEFANSGPEYSGKGLGFIIRPGLKSWQLYTCRGAGAAYQVLLTLPHRTAGGIKCDAHIK